MKIFPIIPAIFTTSIFAQDQKDLNIENTEVVEDYLTYPKQVHILSDENIRLTGFYSSRHNIVTVHRVQ